MQSLRGLLENFQAREAIDVMARIERAANDNQLAEAGRLLAPLERAIARVENVLRPYRGRGD